MIRTKRAAILGLPAALGVLLLTLARPTESAQDMSPADLVAFVAAWQQGGIGGEVLYHNLKAGERLPEGMTFESWQNDIEEFGATAAFMGFRDEETETESDEIN